MKHIIFTVKPQTIHSKTAEITYARIPWDSEYLHNTTVEILGFSAENSSDLGNLLGTLQKNIHAKKGDLFFSKIPLESFNQAILLNQTGFYWAEQTITLTINLSAWNPDAFSFSQGMYTIVPAKTPKDKQDIRMIANSAFTADRYHLDPNIPKKYADYRYEMWVENSFKGKDTVYKFIDEHNTTLGFFIVNTRPDATKLVLAGLDPKYKGSGLGKMLYHHMYEVLKHDGCTQAEAVLSLNNLPVLNVYMYLGHAKFVHPLITFHKII